MESTINFFSVDVDFELPFSEHIVRNWINKISNQEQKEITTLSYIFCSDSYLHKINLEFLQHDTFTDIITFPYAENPIIEGDIFISINRVKENATNLRLPFNQELLRVISHGLFHLCGYGDKTEKESEQMRAKENYAIALFSKNTM